MPSAPGDAELLAPCLRPADVAELEAQGITPLESLSRALELGGCLTLWQHRADQSAPIAMFGVTPGRLLPGFSEAWGAVWLLGSTELESVVKPFLRMSRPWLRVLGQPYQLLINAVDIRNDRHIAWLEKMGARFEGELVAKGPTHFRTFTLDPRNV